MTRTLVWEFDNVPLKGASMGKGRDQVDVVHHLHPELGIFENSIENDENIPLEKLVDGFQSEATKATSIANNPPYAVLTIHMENLSDASVHLNIWQDKKYKTNERMKKNVKKITNFFRQFSVQQKPTNL